MFASTFAGNLVRFAFGLVLARHLGDTVRLGGPVVHVFDVDVNVPGGAA